MAKAGLVFGIYQSAEALVSGVEALRRAGFATADISLLFANPSMGRGEGSEKSAEKVAPGAPPGTLVVATLGSESSVRIISDPGTGPLIAAGPTMASFKQICAPGDLGGITGLLIGLGVPEYEAKGYEARIKSGGILVSIQPAAPGLMNRAQENLERSGALDISFTLEPEPGCSEETVKPVSGVAAAGQAR
ncbi:MAG: DUF3341 domain-containing protein [Terriglobia bacterium]